MRESKVLKKLRAGNFARFCGLGHFMPFFVRYAAHHKYDGIWLDLEHRSMTDREVQALLTMCHLHDIDCMVRPPTLERTRLYRYLEEGASGLMIPFTSNAEIARRVVDSLKFPPDGNRGLDGAGLDADFGLAFYPPPSNWPADANRQTFIVGQIETLEAVENVDEIAAVPGLDVLFIGPGDLGLRMDAAPESALTLDDVIERVSAAALEHNKAWGITAGTPEQLAERRARGARIVPWGGDFFLTKVLEKCSGELDELVGPE
jgi:2-keto-3-deoxy-L-rhamnonate aldolase RhmA